MGKSDQEWPKLTRIKIHPTGTIAPSRRQWHPQHLHHIIPVASSASLWPSGSRRSSSDTSKRSQAWPGRGETVVMEERMRRGGGRGEEEGQYGIGCKTRMSGPEDDGRQRAGNQWVLGLCHTIKECVVKLDGWPASGRDKQMLVPTRVE